MTLALLLLSMWSLYSHAAGPDERTTERYLSQMVRDYGSCTLASKRGESDILFEYSTELSVIGPTIKIRGARSEYAAVGHEKRSLSILIEGTDFIKTGDFRHVELTRTDNSFSGDDACRTQLVLGGCSGEDPLCVTHEWSRKRSASAAPINSGSHGTNLIFLELSSDWETSKKMVAAMQHLQKLRGQTLEDRTLDEDLF